MAQLAALLGRYPTRCRSARHTGQGIQELAVAVSQALSHGFLDVDVETGVENGRLLALIANHGEVLSKRYSENRVIVHCRVPHKALSHLRDSDTTIRPHGRTTGNLADDNGHSTNGNEK